MNRRVLPIALSLSLASLPCVADVVTTQNLLSEFINNKESRKEELNQIVTLVDSTIQLQMKEVTKLINEIQELRATAKRVITEKHQAINKVIEGLVAVDFRIKALYPDQLKTIAEIEKFIKE